MLSFLRQDAEHFNELVVIANLTPVPRLQYRIGLPRPGKWRELLNSDAAVYGGSNMGNFGGVVAADKPWHGQPCSAEFILPPLSILVFGRAAAERVPALTANIAKRAVQSALDAGERAARTKPGGRHANSQAGRTGGQCLPPGALDSNRLRPPVSGQPVATFYGAAAGCIGPSTGWNKPAICWTRP